MRAFGKSLILFLAFFTLTALGNLEDEFAEEEEDEVLEDETEAPPPPGTQRMRFTPPQLTEEEEKSPLLPKSMECDGCHATAHQMHKAFQAAHDKRSHDFRMSEAELLDVVERVCSYDTMEDYGISQDEETGQNRLKGPGVFDKAGVAQMGGRTPFRLSEMCGEIVGEIEEMPIYEEWLNSDSGRTSQTLKRFICSETFCRDGDFHDEF